jgi:hypothetical protein
MLTYDEAYAEWKISLPRDRISYYQEDVCLRKAFQIFVSTLCTTFEKPTACSESFREDLW